LNRKQWMVTGVLLTVVLVVGVMFLRNNKDDSEGPASTGQNTPASTLVYCSDEEVKPCVVSFSLDADENMLVNILLPEVSFPNFHLEIRRGENTRDYKCQRISSALTNAFCLGEKLPPGENLHLTMYSTRDETLLAEGDLSIIGLALPTLAVVSPTSEIAPTEPTAIPLPDDSTPTPTQFQELLPTEPVPATPTPTQPSYPNPSYP
jgi:hypothetical protein